MFDFNWKKANEVLLNWVVFMVLKEKVKVLALRPGTLLLESQRWVSNNLLLKPFSDFLAPLHWNIKSWTLIIINNAQCLIIMEKLNADSLINQSKTFGFGCLKSKDIMFGFSIFLLHHSLEKLYRKRQAGLSRYLPFWSSFHCETLRGCISAAYFFFFWNPSKYEPTTAVIPQNSKLSGVKNNCQ